MADMAVADALKVEQWSKKLAFEYVRDNKFRPLMGKSANAPIQQITTLEKQGAGIEVTVPLITRLEGDGKTGDDTLVGSEIELGNYGHKITIDQIRQAVRRGRFEQAKTFFDLLEAARPMLKKWAMEKVRTDIIVALYSPNVDGSTAYASCSEAQKDAWLAANTDRVLMGAAKSNNATDDHSAALLNIDSTNDTMTAEIGSLMKRMIKSTTGRHVTPTSVSNQGEFFICLCPSLPFRDLKDSTTMERANREAMARGRNNPLFVDGDLIKDGVIYKEIEEIPVLSGVGNGGIDVAACFFLGAQAVGVAVGEKLHAIYHDDDYGNLKGRGVAEIRGVDKLMWNSVQNMGTIYVAAVADT
jgi:hypothetical protein